MSIPSTPMQSIDSRTQQRVDSAGLDIGKRRAHIINVQFAAHAFDVNMDGYGFLTAPVDASIDIGTDQRPKIWRGNDCWVQKDPLTKQWHVTEIIWTKTCIANPVINAPFTPPASSSLPLDTRSLTIPSLPDLTFTPTVIAAGQIVPNTKMPLGTGGGATAKLAMIGKYTFSGAVALSNPQHAMLGDYIFLVAETDNNIIAFNASDIHHINWISNLNLAGIVAGQTAGAGKYLYVWTYAAPNYTLHSIDASNPYAMVAVGTFAATTRGLFGNTHMSIWSRGNTLYLTYVSATAGLGTTRITTLNITNPAAMVLVGDYQPGTDTPVSADVSGQYVYCATSQNNLYVLDYSTPATPAVTSTTALPAVNPNGDLVAGMDYLYWSSSKIYPVNIINPAAPVLGTGVASDPLNPHAQGYAPVRMMLNGSYLVCFLRSAQDAIVTVFSLNTPMAPVFLTRVEDDFIFNSANAYLYSMFAKGRFVYCGGKDESANAALYVYGY